MEYVFKLIQFFSEYPAWLRYSTIIIILIIIFFFIITPRNRQGIEISSIQIFYINIDKNMYQLGVLVNISNLSNKTLSIKKISFRGSKIDMISKGSYRLPLNQDYLIFLKNEISGEILGDNLLPYNSNKQFKLLMPLKQDINIVHPPPFEFVFWGDWEVITTNSSKYNLLPNSFGNYGLIISEKEWENLESAKVKLKHYSFSRYDDNVIENYLLFSKDRTAEIELYGYANTNYARSENGTLVFIRGPVSPTLYGGWKILGISYKEVWENPQKCGIYNSIFKPDPETGEPLPFGSFSGIEMGSNKASPTTRAADVITVHVDKILNNLN